MTRLTRPLRTRPRITTEHTMTFPPLRNEQDIQAFERELPLAQRVPATVYDVFVAQAAASGSAIALSMVLTGEDGEVSLDVSYGELLARITASANLFASLGGPGVGVAYMLPSLQDTHAVLWGAETAGYAVPLNPMLQVDELAALIEASGAKILVTTGSAISPEMVAKAQAIQGRLPTLQVVYIHAARQDAPTTHGGIDYHAALAQQAKDVLTFPRSLDPDGVVAYFHTGGTTGTPKLVAHTNRNQLTAALGSAALLGISSSDVVTNGLPLFHVAGAIATGLAFFMCGARLVVLSPLGLRNPAMIQNFWRIVAQQRVTIVSAVPTALGAILHTPLTSDIGRVRCGITGAAPIPRKVAEGFFDKTRRGLHEILGMTESGGVTAIDPAAGTPTLGAVGLRLPYTQLSVRRRNDDGTYTDECQPGEVGVLFVMGPHVSSGYRGGAAQASPFDGQQLNTGDLAFKDDDGKLHIAGRAKDLIIRSGHNIDPAMIEEAFMAHPDVAAAAAVGQIDAYAGELPTCYVVLKPGASHAVDEVTAFAKTHIHERPAWPKEVYVVDALPLTTVGKVYKPALRADAAMRVLTRELSALIGDALAGVTVTEGGPRGLRATVSLHSSAPAVLDAVTQATGAYVLDVVTRPAA